MKEKRKNLLNFSIVFIFFGIIFSLFCWHNSNYERVNVWERGTVIEIKYAIGGINIQNAIWLIELENGEKVWKGCSSCRYDEIPVVGDRLKWLKNSYYRRK